MALLDTVFQRLEKEITDPKNDVPSAMMLFTITSNGP